MNFPVFLVVLFYLIGAICVSLALFFITFTAGMVAVGLFSLIISVVLYKEISKGGE